MWKFKNIEVKNKVVLAPMAGFTFYSYRKFMSNFGVGLFYSEMVSDCGLIYENDVTLSYLKTDDNEHPFGIQLFGNNADNIIKAMDIIKKENCRCDFIDINLGCPVNKVTKAGSGSSLLKDVTYLKDMMSKICKASSWPISAKIRLGIDDNHINFLEVINALQDAGVSLIAIHARTKKQLYSGKPNYELLKDLRLKMHIPLIVSGDIYTLDDAINALNITKADAVMIARGGIGNPRLCQQIDAYYKDGTVLKDATLKEQKEYCLKLAKMMCEDKGEDMAMRIFRSIGPRFFAGFKNSKKLRVTIASQVSTFQQLCDVVNEFNEEEIELQK